MNNPLKYTDPSGFMWSGAVNYGPSLASMAPMPMLPLCDGNIDEWHAMDNAIYMQSVESDGVGDWWVEADGAIVFESPGLTDYFEYEEAQLGIDNPPPAAGTGGAAVGGGGTPNVNVTLTPANDNSNTYNLTINNGTGSTLSVPGLMENNDGSFIGTDQDGNYYNVSLNSNNNLALTVESNTNSDNSASAFLAGVAQVNTGMEDAENTGDIIYSLKFVLSNPDATNAAAVFGEALGSYAGGIGAVTGGYINYVQWEAGQISGGEFSYDVFAYGVGYAASYSELGPLGGVVVYGLLKTAQYYAPMLEQWEYNGMQNGMQGMPTTNYGPEDWPQ